MAIAVGMTAEISACNFARQVRKRSLFLREVIMVTGAFVFCCKGGQSLKLATNLNIWTRTAMLKEY
jgi:hypothetical protein